MGNGIIDNLGFTTIALTSTNVENEHAALKNDKMEVTEIQRLNVSNQKLEFFFIIDRQNSIFIEIYGIKK